MLACALHLQNGGSRLRRRVSSIIGHVDDWTRTHSATLRLLCKNMHGWAGLHLALWRLRSQMPVLDVR